MSSYNDQLEAWLILALRAKGHTSSTATLARDVIQALQEWRKLQANRSMAFGGLKGLDKAIEGWGVGE